jgi:hypothetical protein
MERVLSVVGQVCLGLALFCALALTSGGCGATCQNGRGPNGVICKGLPMEMGDGCTRDTAEKQCDGQMPKCVCTPIGTGCGCVIPPGS